VNIMAIEGAISSAMGFLEIVIIIMLVREVIRLFGGGTTAKEAGAGIGNAAGSAWDGIKNAWDRKIENRSNRIAEKEKELETMENKMMVYVMDGKNVLEKLKNGSATLKAEVENKATVSSKAGEIQKGLVEPMITLSKRLSNDFAEERKFDLAERAEIDDLDKLVKEIKPVINNIKNIKRIQEETVTELKTSPANQKVLNELDTDLNSIDQELAMALRREDRANDFINKYSDDIGDIGKLLEIINNKLKNLAKLKMGDPKKVTLITEITDETRKLDSMIQKLSTEYSTFMYSSDKFKVRIDQLREKVKKVSIVIQRYENIKSGVDKRPLKVPKIKP
jgi:hypothetical protein